MSEASNNIQDGQAMPSEEQGATNQPQTMGGADGEGAGAMYGSAQQNQSSPFHQPVQPTWSGQPDQPYQSYQPNQAHQPDQPSQPIQTSKGKGISLSRAMTAIVSVFIVVVIAGVGTGAYFIGLNNGAASTMPNFSRQLADMPESGGSLSGEQPEGMGSFVGNMGFDYSMFVDAGIIDQGTADKMKEYVQEQMPSPTQNQSQSQSQDRSAQTS